MPGWNESVAGIQGWDEDEQGPSQYVLGKPGNPTVRFLSGLYEADAENIALEYVRAHPVLKWRVAEIRICGHMG